MKRFIAGCTAALLTVGLSALAAPVAFADDEVVDTTSTEVVAATTDAVIPAVQPVDPGNQGGGGGNNNNNNNNPTTETDPFSEKNKTSSWETTGVTCVKGYNSLSVGEIDFPSIEDINANLDSGESPIPSDATIVKVIVKAGAPSALGGADPNYVFTPPFGDTLFSDPAFGKDISHIIFCYTLPDDEPLVATASASAVAPYCDGETPVAGVVSVTGVSNATYDEEAVAAIAGPGTFDIEFTAEGDATFAEASNVTNGGTTKTIRVTLAAAPADCDDVDPVVATVSVTLTDPTCEVGQTLVFGPGSSATWAGGSADGTTEVGPFSTSFVANGSALFDPALDGTVNGVTRTTTGGGTQVTFTGVLVGPDTTSIDCNTLGLAEAAVSVTPATCLAPAKLVYGEIINATFSGTANGTTGPGPFKVIATADKGESFDSNILVMAVDGVYSEDFLTKTFEGVLGDKLSGPDCDLTTLALTGSETTPLFLSGAAALMLLGGAGVFFTRRRTQQ